VAAWQVAASALVEQGQVAASRVGQRAQVAGVQVAAFQVAGEAEPSLAEHILDSLVRGQPVRRRKAETVGAWQGVLAFLRGCRSEFESCTSRC
jgi:hypothetical protein